MDRNQRSSKRISVQTLIIASIASVAASFAASKLWGAGTLVSAAATPVIVALVSEFLRRPVQTVAETAKKVPAVPVVPVYRRRTTSAEDPTDALQDPTRVAADPASAAEARPPSAEAEAPQEPAGAPPAPDVPATAQDDDSSRGRSWWRLAVVTGLLAFAIAAVIVTVPELIAGHSISGSGDPTTLFGGSSTANKTATATTSTATTTTTPTTTITRTAPSTTATKTSSTSAATTTTTKTTTSTTTTTTTSTTPAGAQSTSSTPAP